MWVYVRSEPDLYTVGFYDPSGKWQPDGDYNDREQAARRCAWLNGAIAAPHPAADDDGETGEEG